MVLHILYYNIRYVIWLKRWLAESSQYYQKYNKIRERDLIVHSQSHRASW